MIEKIPRLGELIRIFGKFSQGEGKIQKRKAIMAENIEEKYMLGISKDAKAIFRAVLKELNLNENIKLKLDFAVLSIFSQACIDYAKFNEKLQSDSLTPTEYYNLYNNRQLAKKDIMSSASKLGLTPTDRKRLGIEYTGDRKPTEVEKLLGIR